MRDAAIAWRTSHRWMCAFAGMTLLCAYANTDAQAQSGTYPNRPLRIVVPGMAGTSPDLLARTIAHHLTPRIGQPIVIMNQPGGGGNIGHGTAAKATPDGYTLLVTSDQLSINESLFKNLPFHAVKSFAPVVQAIVSPQVLIVNTALPFKDVAGLVSYARTNPGKLNFGSPQIGTVGHLAGELLKRAQKLEMTHVPFQGATAAIREIIAGQVQMMFVTLPPALGHIQQGTVRALAVSTTNRSTAIPNVPALYELGMKEFDFGAWQGVFAPAGTPREVITRLNTEINAILKDPEASGTLVKLGFTPVGGTPDEFQKLVSSNIGKWGRVIREANIKAQ
ncbi:MAG TPA: tripartite tricarboxylate transporter substrate binding protein [Burkholderiales bacterium]|nr:tripartite tricarboxylate transporter substrate binding protein [Burkholderiales bacterium]